MRTRAYGLIQKALEGTPDALYTESLQDLEYRVVEYMIDEEQDRASEQGRTQMGQTSQIYIWVKNEVYSIVGRTTKKRVGYVR